MNYMDWLVAACIFWAGVIAGVFVTALMTVSKQQDKE